MTEPGAGSDFAAIATQARQADGRWRLDGRKAWITNANHADVAIVYAQTRPDSGAAGIAALVVDASRPGFHREPGVDVGAVRSMGTGGFRLEGFVCRAEEMLAPPGQAFKPILHAINGARVCVAALLHAMGAEGLSERHPLLRHLAAAQVAGLVDGSTEMLKERVAKELRAS